MKKLFTLVMLFCVFATVYTQQSPNTPTTNIANPKWEYLVICFGKTYFNDAEKSFLYFSTQELPDEGTGLQERLDILGTNGWDVVGVIGSIGGDQQIILKRLYNAQVVEKEKIKNELLKKEREQKKLAEFEKYMEEQIQLLQIEKDKGTEIELAASKKENLIDRDQLDSWEISKRKLAEQEDIAKKEKENDTKYILSFFDNYQYAGLTKTKQISNNTYELTLNFDVTDQFLINTNQYRSSVTKEFATARANDFHYDSHILKRTRVIVNVHCYITYNNQILEVSKAEKYIDPYHSYK